MKYLYLYEDLRVACSTKAPTNKDIVAMELGTLRVFRISDKEQVELMLTSEESIPEIKLFDGYSVPND